jgi:hypothetical protein
MVFLHSKNIDGSGCHVPSGGEGYTAEKVKTDPQTPRIIVRKVGDGSQTSEEPEGRDYESYENDDPHDNIERGQE